jgi:hypothetical protein
VNTDSAMKPNTFPIRPALRQRMLAELQRRNYNPDTVRGYIHAVEEFARYSGNLPTFLAPTRSASSSCT